MSEKAANVQRKTLKDLQKAWRTIDQDHFKDYRKVCIRTLIHLSFLFCGIIDKCEYECLCIMYETSYHHRFGAFNVNKLVIYGLKRRNMRKYFPSSHSGPSALLHTAESRSSCASEVSPLNL